MFSGVKIREVNSLAHSLGDFIIVPNNSIWLTDAMIKERPKFPQVGVGVDLTKGIVSVEYYAAYNECQ